MEELFYEIFSDLPRQGPGDNDSTIKAASKITSFNDNPKILDVGCGTGMQTFELIKFFGGTVYAIDNHVPYLNKLCSEAQRKGFGDEIICLEADMLNPDFIKERFNLIWAEGSIYIVGFENGLKAFKKLLKPKGFIAVTEVSWLKEDPPPELFEFWEREYPAIKNIQDNLKVIDSLGYKQIDHFILPESSWWNDYYYPLEERVQNLYLKYHEDEDAMELLDFVQFEIDMFRKYADYYGYVFYIMQKQ